MRQPRVALRKDSTVGEMGAEAVRAKRRLPPKLAWSKFRKHAEILNVEQWDTPTHGKVQPKPISIFIFLKILMTNPDTPPCGQR